jgi:outer membrane biosynthesis protein TonB
MKVVKVVLIAGAAIAGLAGSFFAGYKVGRKKEKKENEKNYEGVVEKTFDNLFHDLSSLDPLKEEPKEPVKVEQPKDQPKEEPKEPVKVEQPKEEPIKSQGKVKVAKVFGEVGPEEIQKDKAPEYYSFLYGYLKKLTGK